MIPTNKFRWFRFHLGGLGAHKHPSAMVQPHSAYGLALQQWWVVDPDLKVGALGEWRDVPIEQE